MIVYKNIVKRIKAADGVIETYYENAWYDTCTGRRLTRKDDIDYARYASRIPSTTFDRIIDAYLEDFNERHCEW